MADKKYLKELIRKALIRDPSVSVRRLAELLNIDKNTALKYRNEVVEENRARMQEEIEKLRKRSLEEEIVGFEEEAKELIIELWKIISKVDSSKKEKISAIRTLVNTRRQLFDLKFDAGLFARKLGEMDLNVSDLVKKIKQEMRDGSRKESTDNSQEHLEL